MSRKVQEIYTGKDDEESTEKGKRVDGICRVEPLEEDERGAQRGGGEGHIIEGVDSV